jgi:hypothetical protein
MSQVFDDVRPGRVDWMLGPPRGRRMMVLRSGRSRPQLLILAPKCCLGGERERRGSGATGGRRDGAKCTRGHGAKPDKVGAKAD